jgi:hypothetical protein
MLQFISGSLISSIIRNVFILRVNNSQYTIYIRRKTNLLFYIFYFIVNNSQYYTILYFFTLYIRFLSNL